MPEKSDLGQNENQFSSHISVLLKDRFFWLSLLLGGFVLSFTLWFTMGADAGMLSYCSWVWAHYNLPPYVGCVTENFPGIFIIHWLILKIFGESAPGFRAFDFLVQLGSLVMIFYITRRLFQSGLAGFFGALFYATYYYNLDYGFTGEREGFILCLTLVAVIIHLALERRFFLRAGLVGLLVGFCFLIKPTSGLLWLAFGAWYLISGFKQRRKKLWLEMLVFFACCLSPCLMVVFFYYRSGHLRDMFQMLYLLDFKLYSQAPILLEPDAANGRFQISRIMLFLYQAYKIASDNPLSLLGAATAIFMGVSDWRSLKEKNLFLMVLALAMAGLLPVFIQKRFNDYERLPFQGFAVLLGGGGLFWLVQKVKEHGRSLKPGLTNFIFGLLITVMILGSIRPRLIMFALKYGYRDLNSAYAYQTPYEQPALNFLEPMLRPDDQVYYFGKISALPFQLRKKLPAPLPEIYPMIWKFGNRALTPLQQEWRQNYIDTFLKIEPRFFIFDSRYSIDFFDLPIPAVILSREFSPIKKSLDEDYIVIGKFGPIAIYELKSSIPFPR